MSDKFSPELFPVDKIPSRQFKKTSMYDKTLDLFLDSVEKQVGLRNIGDRKVDYVASQLKKRIKARNLPITVVTSNGIIYLQKTN